MGDSMRRFLFYLLAAAVTLYTAVLYGSTSFLMLFFVELGLPVLLILLSIPLVKGLRVDLQLPIPVAEQGQSVPVTISLKNNTVIPSGRIAVRISSYLPMSRRAEKTWFYGSISGRRGHTPAQVKVQTEYDASSVGSIQMEISRVWCYDLLGLVAFPLPKRYWKQIEPEMLLVVPKISEVPVFVSRQSRDFAGESEEYSKERKGSDPTEVFQIRDYQRGDRLRSIHWKLSVKTGDLMVCEHSLPLGCPVLLYLNLFWKSHGKQKRKLKQDEYLQIVASLSHAMVQEGCRHYVIWFDSEQSDIRRYRVEKEEDVYEMLIQLGRLSIYSQQWDLVELYQQKYYENQYITKLELTMDRNLYCNGTIFKKYGKRGEELEQQLAECEIIV